MENISGDLEWAQLQKEIVFKAYEQVRSQVSSVLLFTLEWKDLEERFDGIRSSLERQAKELETGERSLVDQAREVASREDSLLQRVEECEEEIQMKKMDLRSIDLLIEEHKEELKSKKKEFVGINRLINERSTALALKDSELENMMKRVKQCKEEAETKREDLASVQVKLEEVAKALELKRGEFNAVQESIEDRNLELASKKTHLESIQIDITQRAEHLRLIEQEFAFIQTSTLECNQVLECKKKQCDLIQKSIETSTLECNQVLECKKKQCDLMQKSIETSTLECNQVLECKKKQCDLMQKSIETSTLECNQVLECKKKQCDLMQKSITECSQELNSKTRQLDSIQKRSTECNADLELQEKQLYKLDLSIGEYSQELNSKTRQLDSIQKRSTECIADLELKEKQLYKLDVSIGEYSQVLEMKKKECNETCMELELWRQRLDSFVKSIEKRSREMELREGTSGHSGVTAQNLKYLYGHILPACQNSQFTIGFDGKKVQMFIYQHLQELSRFRHKVMDIIQTSSNAAKLVLDAMEGFYPQDSGNKDALLDTGMIRRSCIFLLDNLIRSSAEIKPQQREAAMKLAVHWKGKLKFSLPQEYPLEVLGFLKLLEAYKLASAFNANEIHDLVNSVSQFQMEQELQQLLGSSALPPGSFGSIRHCQEKAGELENFAVHNIDDSSVVNPPVPTVSAREDLQLQTELLNENAMICEQISHRLQQSSDPAKLVLDVFVVSYAQYSKSKDMNLETDVLRSQIVLLEQLVRISPLITHEVKEGAMKLAREWKVKLLDKPTSGLEVLAFQHFLAAYNLVSLLTDSEILKLGEIVSQNDEDPPMRQTPGIVNNITAHQLAYLLLSGVQPQQPGLKKRSARDPATDVQAQPDARKCKYQVNNQGGPM